MTYKTAYKIFTHIRSNKYTIAEKNEAIYTVSHAKDVINLPGYAYLMEVIRWRSEMEPAWERAMREKEE